MLLPTTPAPGREAGQGWLPGLCGRERRGRRRGTDGSEGSTSLRGRVESHYKYLQDAL